MNLSQNLVLSLEILGAHKLRTLLSVLGVVVGVGAVVLMVSAGRGAQRQILGRIRAMGTNLVIVQAGQTMIVAGRQRQASAVKTLRLADARAIAQECPSVALAAPVVRKKLTVRWEDQTAVTSVMGMSVEGLAASNTRIARGWCFDHQESRAAKRVAVLGPAPAANLFGAVDPIGHKIRIGKVLFEVIGVTIRKGMDVNGVDQDDVILVPLQTAMRRLLNVTHVQTICVQAKSPDLLDKAEAEVAELLHERHRLGDKADDFTIQNQATLLEAERQTIRSMSLLIGSVAGVSLLVGGAGILAVTLMSVRERTHETGLRRAVGARRRDIRNQFLLESVMLAGTGGVAGVILGVGAAMAVSALGYWPMVISWPAVGLAFGFSVAVGLVFGVYPATRAARLQPLGALRAE